MKFFNKGQAALEFLTTYGWAFLVILVMIGGLSYFGVFDFKSKMPDSCTFSGRDIECKAWQINNDADSDQIKLRIKNLGERDMYVKGIKLLERSLSNDGGAFCSFTNSTDIQLTNPSITYNGQIAPHTESDLVFTNTSALDVCGIRVGEKGTYDVVLQYTTSSSSDIESTVTGIITTTVIES